MRLSKFRRPATSGLTVTASGDRRGRNSRSDENWQRKPNYLEKTYPSATFLIKNTT
jgi:hypothetical protein